MLLVVFVFAFAGAYTQGKLSFTTLVTVVRSVRSVLTTLAACLAFMIAGPALMMLNKHIMDDLQFHYPIAICSLGLVSSSLVSFFVVHLGLGEVREESRKVVAGIAWFQVAMPIGVLKALTMSMGNAVYLHLSFGFIQMLKAFTPLIVLLVMRAAGVRLPTRSAVWCVTLIVAGTMMEVQGELHATALGLFLMLSSELFEAISVVLSQKILQNHKFTVLEGLYITAPPGAASLLLGVTVLEARGMLEAGHHRIPMQYPCTFASAAALGVAVNFISFLVMQRTSALTMKILNTARSVGLVVVGVLFYREVHPWVQLGGYAVALVGFAGYNLFQMYAGAARAMEARVDGFASRFMWFCPRHLRPGSTVDYRDKATTGCGHAAAGGDEMPRKDQP